MLQLKDAGAFADSDGKEDSSNEEQEVLELENKKPRRWP